MEHSLDRPLDPSDALIRPWRTAAYVAGAIAAVELVVLLVIGGGALVGAVADRLQLEAQQTVEVAPETTAPKSKRSTRSLAAARAERPRSKTTVLVLNGNGRTGAAATAAERISRRGYRIGRVGNASSQDFARSFVMYRRGFVGEARRLARDLGIKAVAPLDGMRPRDLGRAHVVFILGR